VGREKTRKERERERIDASSIHLVRAHLVLISTALPLLKVARRRRSRLLELEAVSSSSSAVSGAAELLLVVLERVDFVSVNGDFVTRRDLDGVHPGGGAEAFETVLRVVGKG
jgi:hypothetical protein